MNSFTQFPDGRPVKPADGWRSIIRISDNATQSMALRGIGPSELLESIQPDMVISAILEEQSLNEQSKNNLVFRNGDLCIVARVENKAIVIMTVLRVDELQDAE